MIASAEVGSGFVYQAAVRTGSGWSWVSRVAGQSLVSDALWANRPEFDVVHVHAEFAGASSVQDPTMARIALVEVGNFGVYLPLVTK